MSRYCRVCIEVQYEIVFGINKISRAFIDLKTTAFLYKVVSENYL